jgi:hypothetical protein
VNTTSSKAAGVVEASPSIEKISATSVTPSFGSHNVNNRQPFIDRYVLSNPLFYSLRATRAGARNPSVRSYVLN